MRSNRSTYKVKPFGGGGLASGAWDKIYPNPPAAEPIFVRPVRFECIHIKCGGHQTLTKEVAENLATAGHRVAELACFSKGCFYLFPLAEFCWAETGEVVGS